MEKADREVLEFIGDQGKTPSRCPTAFQRLTWISSFEPN